MADPTNDTHHAPPLADNVLQPDQVRRRPSTSSDYPQEVTELDEITAHYSPSSASLSSGEYRVTPHQSVASASGRSSVRRDKQSFQAIRRFWSRNVALTVPRKGNRDYFGECRHLDAQVVSCVVEYKSFFLPAKERGTVLQFSNARLSPRTDIPRIHANGGRAVDARRADRTAVPPAGFTFRPVRLLHGWDPPVGRVSRLCDPRHRHGRISILETAARDRAGESICRRMGDKLYRVDCNDRRFCFFSLADRGLTGLGDCNVICFGDRHHHRD